MIISTAHDYLVTSIEARLNGASLRFSLGEDLGPKPGPASAFIEWAGLAPNRLADGSTRSFLEDADTVTISLRARGRDGVEIGLGEVMETILSAADASGARREELAAADASSG